MAEGKKKTGKKSKSAKKARKPRGVLDLPKAVEDRMAEGRTERERVSLEAHAEWEAPGDRPDPVGVLEEQNVTRVPDLVPVRHRPRPSSEVIATPPPRHRAQRAVRRSAD